MGTTLPGLSLPSFLLSQEYFHFPIIFLFKFLLLVVLATDFFQFWGFDPLQDEGENLGLGFSAHSWDFTKVLLSILS